MTVVIMEKICGPADSIMVCNIWELSLNLQLNLGNVTLGKKMSKKVGKATLLFSGAPDIIITHRNEGVMSVLRDNVMKDDDDDDNSDDDHNSDDDDHNSGDDDGNSSQSSEGKSSSVQMKCL